MIKKVSIFGSTGSIGQQSIEVCKHLGIEVEILVAKSSIDILLGQIQLVHPKVVVLEDKEAADKLRSICLKENYTCEVYSGRQAILEIARHQQVDIMIASMVGMAGLEPVIEAIRAGIDIALANKETLVAAGKLVLAEAKKAKVQLLPVDSEHSAIWQCLAGHQNKQLKRIFLTCSGGPFRGKTKVELEQVTVADALAHPTWSMGGKISIDSATLMNKGLELIEACHLFAIDEKNVEIVVHPQSVIHSMVEYFDHSVIAQLSWPDMRLPIQYALTYPDREPSLEQAFNPFAPENANLTFEQVDESTFSSIRLARMAQQEGNYLPIVFNAANEIAVQLFFENEIHFLEIEKLVEETMQLFQVDEDFDPYVLENIINTDRNARILAQEIASTWRE